MPKYKSIRGVQKALQIVFDITPPRNSLMLSRLRSAKWTLFVTFFLAFSSQALIAQSSNMNGTYQGTSGSITVSGCMDKEDNGSGSVTESHLDIRENPVGSISGNVSGQGSADVDAFAGSGSLNGTASAGTTRSVSGSFGGDVSGFFSGSFVPGTGTALGTLTLSVNGTLDEGCVYSGTITLRGPETYDLEVYEVEPVQTVFYPERAESIYEFTYPHVELIANKQTAVKVTVTVDNVRALRNDSAAELISIELTFGVEQIAATCSKTDFRDVQRIQPGRPAGKCVKILTVSNATSGGTAKAKVTVPQGAFDTDLTNNEHLRSYQLSSTGSLSIVYVPILGPGFGLFSSYPAPANVIQTITASDTFIGRRYPLSNGGVTSTLRTSIIGSMFNFMVLGENGIDRDLRALREIADGFPTGTKVVGLVHPSYFHNFHGEPGVYGIGYVVGSASIVSSIGHGVITGHEIGHNFGLRHPVNTTGSYVTGWESGDREIPQRYQMMGNGFIGTWDNRAWIHTDEYESIRSRLVGSGRPPFGDLTSIQLERSTPGRTLDTIPSKRPLLVVSALLFGSNVVEPFRWYTTTNSELTGVGSEMYRIRATDKFGNEIFIKNAEEAVFSNNLLAENQHFVLSKVPLDKRTAFVEILHNNDVAARYSVPGKFLRDAVIGIPNSAFVSDSETSRGHLLGILDRIDEAIDSLHERQALSIIRNELRPSLELLLQNAYLKETYLQYDKDEVFESLRFAESRLIQQQKHLPFATLPEEDLGDEN